MKWMISVAAAAMFAATPAVAAPTLALAPTASEPLADVVCARTKDDARYRTGSPARRVSLLMNGACRVAVPGDGFIAWDEAASCAERGLTLLRAGAIHNRLVDDAAQEAQGRSALDAAEAFDGLAMQAMRLRKSGATYRRTCGTVTAAQARRD